MEFLIREGSDSFSVTVAPEGTIRSLKREIAKVKGYKVSHIRLIYGGEVLKNTRLISTVEYTPGKSIDLVLDRDDEDVKPVEVIPKTKDELDNDFVGAVYNEPLRQRMNDARVLDCISIIQDQLVWLADAEFGDYQDLIQRLDLVPGVEPDLVPDAPTSEKPTPPPTPAAP